MKHLSILLIVALALASCTKEDPLAFDVVESPVLAEFEEISTPADAMLSVVGVFSDLDKSGILDKNVGIQSNPIQGLEITVFVNGDTKLTSVTTDSDGAATFEYSKDELAGISRLEWVGEYDGVSFRIYYKF